MSDREVAVLFHNYKLLQFFDTLGLYFCMEHAGERTISTFLNVPRAINDDVTITVTPIDKTTYQVQPFPFAQDPFVVLLPGTIVEANPSITTAHVALSQGLSNTETITLIS